MLRKESPLFTPVQIGNLTLPNRFIASAISFRGADQYGFPSQEETNHIKRLARGRVGLIIPGYMYTAKSARIHLWQDGMSSTCHADAWKDIIEEVHNYGSKIIFQIAHSGLAQDTTSLTLSNLAPQVPKGVSMLFEGTQEFTIPELNNIIKTFGKAAKLLKSAGADGIQLQCAHGFMLSQFLSPFTNRRHDDYGGSVQNRARIVREIIAEIKKNTSDDFQISCKLNLSDCVKGGITPDIAQQVVSILANDGVKMFEFASGLVYPWTSARGKNKLLKGKLQMMYNELIEQNKTNDLGKPISPEDVKKFKERFPETKFSVNGGLRKFDDMEKIIKDEAADFVSLGRPLLKEPYLVQRFFDGANESDCDDCNQCFTNPPFMTRHCHKSQALPVE